MLEYAEVATAVRPRWATSCAPRCGRRLSDAEFVELAAWVALENFRSRFNGGLGLRSQGFSDSCEVSMPAPWRRAGGRPSGRSH